MDTADKHVFFDKLTFVYLEMPKFNKTEDQLENMFDKWGSSCFATSPACWSVLPHYKSACLKSSSVRPR